MAANIPPAAAILPAAAIPVAAAILAPPIVEPPIAPPAYETTLAMATDTIGNLPTLHPRPNHSNIRALERDLFDKLQAIQSAQSDEWGYRGLAEQPAEYAMKSATPWMDAPNPGPHRSVGLNAQLTRDAEAIYDASKMEYLSQLNVTQAIINALNIAVPKEFKRGTNAAGTIMGASPYRNNNNPRTILLALRTLYGRPTPAEKQANNALFGAPWNPADPIETYFDRLEDCFVTAIIATPPYTMAQMMDMAIMTLQITGLYSQALTEWESKPPIDRTWDALKSHFATAYNLRLISGTTTAGHAGYHSASNVVENDDTLNNIEQTLNHELSNLHSASNANHQSTQQLFSAFKQQLAAITQQLAQMAPTTANATTSGRNRNRGNTTRTPQMPAVGSTLPLPPGIPAVPITAAVPAPAFNRRAAPNNNKHFNNLNYCFSCGYDVAIWHTSATCGNPKLNHQTGCTRQNVAQYEALGHLASKKGIHKTIMPVNPLPNQA